MIACAAGTGLLQHEHPLPDKRVESSLKDYEIPECLALDERAEEPAKQSKQELKQHQ